MSNSCPSSSCVSWRRPNTAFFLYSSRSTSGSEGRSFHSHRLSFKEDHALVRIPREGYRKQIYCFYAKVKPINECEVEETCTLTSDCHVGYRVKEGDTLTAIANRFKTKVHSIALANKIVDVHYIPAGKLLLIPLQSIKSDQVKRENYQSLVAIKSIINDEVDTVSTLSQNIFQKFPEHSSSSVFQSHHVRVASYILVLLAVVYIIKKCRLYFDVPRHEDVVLQNVRGAGSQPRVRRWEGILKEDENITEANVETFPEQTISELEDEELEESYAELESMYVQFLADSGLSTSGYWRGGAPVASDKD